MDPSNASSTPARGFTTGGPPLGGGGATELPPISFGYALPSLGSSTAFAASSDDVEYIPSNDVLYRRPAPIGFGAEARSTSAFSGFEPRLPASQLSFGDSVARSGDPTGSRFATSDYYLARPQIRSLDAASSSSFQGFQSHISSVRGAALPEPSYLMVNQTQAFFGSDSVPQGNIRPPPPLRIVGDHLPPYTRAEPREHNPFFGRFRDTSFKKKLCIYWLSGSCREGESCRFAHGKQDLIKSQAYKTLICQEWQQGMCRLGARCSFAHGEQEKRPGPPCPFFARGEPCPRQSRGGCGYRHGH